MSEEPLRKKTRVSINVISNGYVLEVYPAGTDRYDDGQEEYFHDLDIALARIKQVLS